jgi:pyruvate/2-oxoglutarate dehydrogenase complex dihydrolipoamide dehydrogenase (E3) component
MTRIQRTAVLLQNSWEKRLNRTRRTGFLDPARLPDDSSEETLNTMAEIATDICVIGGGAGGVSIAAGASQLGRKVVLVEQGAMGGTCLNAGCIPSNALFAAARAAEAQRNGREFGIATANPAIDAVRLHEHIRGTISQIAPHDSQAHLESLGVTIIREAARFVDKKTVRAGETSIRARDFVIATGSRPVAPAIPGLDTVPYLTPETLFDRELIPQHLIVLGGGSTGIELAQAYRRLGSKVTVIDSARMLAQYDHELVQILFDRLRQEGISLREGAKISKVARNEDGSVRLEIARVQGAEAIDGSHLLIAAGRTPNIESLDLDKAGIKTNGSGIKVDEKLRTTNRHVHAIGDVVGAQQFTHVAGWHAGLVLRNLVLKRGVHASHDAAPTLLHTDPEIASIGLNRAAAERQKIAFDVVSTTLNDTDRGQTDRVGESLVEVVIGKKGRVLGVSMVAPNASELILPWGIMVSEEIPLSRLADLTVPYPSFGEHMKRIAASYYSRTLFNGRRELEIGILARLR